MGVSEAAARLNVSRPTLSKIINGKTGTSADMALRLEAFLGNPSEFWLDLQKAIRTCADKASETPRNTTDEGGTGIE